MNKTLIVMALCLCALPVLMARGLTEEELMTTALLVEGNTALSVEEQSLIASGMYGNAPSGGYGGQLEDGTSTPYPSSDDTLVVPESGSATSSPASTTPTATTNQQKAANSASSAQLSLMAGVVVAAAALML